MIGLSSLPSWIQWMQYTSLFRYSVEVCRVYTHVASSVCNNVTVVIPCVCVLCVPCMLLTGFGEAALERQHCFACQDLIECGMRQIFENRFPELASVDDMVRLYQYLPSGKKHLAETSSSGKKHLARNISKESGHCLASSSSG